MKRLSALFCAVLVLSFSLCACTQDLVDDAKSKVSEISSDLTPDSTDTNGLTDNSRIDAAPTAPVEDTTDGIYTEEGNMATEWQDMVENGEVEDGDGNIGDLENRDGDANTDVEAAENAQERVSADENENK